MKNKLIIGALAGTLVAPSAFAAHDYFKESYVGLEVIQTNQDYKNGWGKGIFKKNPQNYGVLAGFKFHNCFGVELGYEFQPKRKTSPTIAAGQQTINGGTLTTGATGFSNNSIQGSHPYFGLTGEYKHKWGMGDLSLMAMVGASVSHIKAQATVVSISGIATNAVRNYSKTKVVPMVKLSATNYFHNNVGVRVLVNYRNLSALKINADSGTSMVKLKNTFGVGLGLLYRFA